MTRGLESGSRDQPQAQGVGRNGESRDGRSEAARERMIPTTALTTWIEPLPMWLMQKCWNGMPIYYHLDLKDLKETAKAQAYEKSSKAV
mmetsp:Transcript_147874/g.258471  ORF Transcript_147874/g.258471 Transcript_147874/m.258471 type:complete len:89 (-) Transcript_147874:3-269(-)